MSALCITSSKASLPRILKAVCYCVLCKNSISIPVSLKWFFTNFTENLFDSRSTFETVYAPSKVLYAKMRTKDKWLFINRKHALRSNIQVFNAITHCSRYSFSISTVLCFSIPMQNSSRNLFQNRWSCSKSDRSLRYMIFRPVLFVPLIFYLTILPKSISIIRFFIAQIDEEN
jgi:hypothetical protein